MTGLLSAFTGDFELSPKTAPVIIAPLDAYGKIDTKLGGAKALQYWPDTLSESKTINWQTKDVTGAPLPLYQWVTGGERTFSFTAYFTRDMYGEIGTDIEEDKHNVDIDAAIAWLHSLSTVDYDTVGDVGNAAIAPPLLWLYFQGTKIGYSKIANDTGCDGGIYCVMTELSVERTAFFPNGTPRIATASLGFAEVMQLYGGVYPYGRKNMLELANRYKGPSFK